MQNEKGEIIGASGFSEDITERRMTEEYLRQSKEQLRLILQSTGDGIYGVNLKGNCTFVNKAAARMLGYKPSEMFGKNMHTLIHFARSDGTEIPASECSLLAAFRLGRGIHIENEVLWRKDKTSFPAETSLFPIRSAGEITGAVVTFSDITARKELEERKDEFISIASHELKTPVTALKMYIQFLEKKISRTKGLEDTAHSLEKMEQQVERLTDLVNDLLNLSRIQAGKLAFRYDYFDLFAVVKEHVENVQASQDTHTVLLEGGIREKVWGDSDRIGQVVINLLTNAVKYSPKAKKVIVTIRKRKHDVVVNVRDFGIGISKKDRDLIFERFYQAGGKEKPSVGLGIGLYLSKEIIARHNGKIWVESEKGKGSTFSFSLPLKKPSRKMPE